MLIGDTTTTTTTTKHSHTINKINNKHSQKKHFQNSKTANPTKNTTGHIELKVLLCYSLPELLQCEKLKKIVSEKTLSFIKFVFDTNVFDHCQVKRGFNAKMSKRLLHLNELFHLFIYLFRN